MRQRVFDSGTDVLVYGVQVLLPRGKFLALAGLAVGDDHLRVAPVGAIGHHVHARAPLVHARVPVGPAVVAVARHRVPERDPPGGCWRR